MAKRPAPPVRTLAPASATSARLKLAQTALLVGAAILVWTLVFVYVVPTSPNKPEKGEPVKYFQELVDLMAHDPNVYAFFTPHGLAVEVVGSDGRVGKTFTLTEIETSALNPITEALPRLRAEANDEVSE